jgi:Kef-type K+ transport system membrane component KefB
VSQIDTTSFFVVVMVAGAAGVLSTSLESRLIVSVVVIELLLGILVGPQVLHLAKPSDFVAFFSNLGLAMLFFFAGYEIDIERVKGRPLELAAGAWALSLALAFGIGGLLALAGVALSLLYTGSAMATTAMGTLVPILKDSGDLKSRFGTYLLAAGALGEFGPILLVTLFLSTGEALGQAALLLAFMVGAAIAGLLAVRSAGRGWEAIERTFETSSQLAIRLLMILVIGLVALATQLSLDVLLGGFVAGMIARLAVRGREVRVFESKITAIGYGFLIPFFFVYSGMDFDASSLFSTPGALAKLFMFLGLFLVVRATPALLLYRRVMPLRDRFALGFYSATELPMVVAITDIAVAEGHMRTSTAAALVGAGILSTLVYPLVAMRLRSGSLEPAHLAVVEEPEMVASPGG